MELLVSSDSPDYCVLKVQATASLAGLDVSVNRTATNESLLALNAQARSMILRHDEDKFLAQHNAILRYIAQQAPASGLYSGSEYEVSQVVSCVPHDDDVSLMRITSTNDSRLISGSISAGWRWRFP